MVVGLALLPAGAALLLTGQDATAQMSECPLILQDDIVVKPGGGTGKAMGRMMAGSPLIWCHSGRKLVAGNPYYLRNDVTADVDFLLAHGKVGKMSAHTVVFPIKYAGESYRITLRVKQNKFEWETDPGVPFKSCDHDKTQPKHCYEDGIPPLFMGELEGDIMAMDKDGKKIEEVTQINFRGKIGQ
jgi:hypothetical protein